MSTNNGNVAVHPVFVFAPTARCGITLIQRLLNSSGEIIVYGENAIIANTLPQNMFRISITAKSHEDARRKLLDGEYDFWSSAIWPDIKEWSGSVIGALDMFLRTYQDCSAKDGFDKWGIKNPVDDARYCAFFYETFPSSKIIFVYRHILDVVKSYKARKWLPDVQACSDLVVRWRNNVNYMLGCNVHDRVMLIRYEEMVAKPARYAELLEKFAGLSGIDQSVFERRINTFKGTEENGHSPDQYIQPSDLSEQEIDVIRELSDDFLKHCKYPSVDEKLEELLIANR